LQHIGRKSCSSIIELLAVSQHRTAIDSQQALHGVFMLRKQLLTTHGPVLLALVPQVLITADVIAACMLLLLLGAAECVQNDAAGAACAWNILAAGRCFNAVYANSTHVMM
jgi:hypothetical protein